MKSMNYLMNKKDFIEQCNKSPLFQKKGVTITKDTLAKYNFNKKEYVLQDLVHLRALIFLKPKKITRKPEKPQIRQKLDIPQILNELPKPREKDFYSLKVIDLLRVIPAFEEKVAGIRKMYNINPQKFKKELSKIVPNKHLLRTIRAFETPRGFNSIKYKIYRRIGKGWYRNLQKIIKTYNQMHSWEETQCPLLSWAIGKLRIVDLGRIPLSWSMPIKNYILYKEISDDPLFFRRSANSPETAIKSDPQTLELYIEIKIYGDTDLDVKDIRTMRKFQKLLPTYHRMNQKIHNTTFRRWIYYFLRKNVGLKHKEANKWLETYGFNPIDYQYASQELKRFEGLFKKLKK